MKKTKQLLFSLLAFLALPILAQESKEIIVKTDVAEATVFINGAQITRNKAIDLPAGKSKIRFTNLSPYIDAKSVQVKVNGEVMVTSVNHQHNYIDSVKPKIKPMGIDEKIETVTDQIALETANRETITAEYTFLEQNKKVSGDNTGLSLATLRETSTYYRDRILALKKQDLELIKKIKNLNVEKTALLKELEQGGGVSKKEQIGEVVVEIECKTPVRINSELSYYVKNAGWYPTYDIRATNVNEPIELIYKANVRQNTKEEWKNIKLKVSSSDPNLGNVAPQLNPYYLNYYTPAPRYNTEIGNNEISGVIVDAKTNEPLIGATATFQGTTIGAVSDVDGRFTLVIPQNASTVNFNYVGYNNQSLPISRNFMTVRMQEATGLLDEVVVVGYGTQKNKEISSSLQGRMAGVSVSNSDLKIRGISSIAMPNAQVETQTAVEFEIKIPYTIKSDNKNTLIEVDRYELPADYEYYAAPKVTKDAFLLANVTDWEKYNLLEGEANIFFENTYIGKTILDVRSQSDTLNISLGRDKNVLVTRDKQKEMSTKKFLGSKKEEVRDWKITVKNNKKQTINMVILDQIPVSTLQEIEVERENLSGGAVNPLTGDVKWKMEIKPTDKKELRLTYKVKYPKDKNLTIE